jgi:hypothetical protein
MEDFVHLPLVSMTLVHLEGSLTRHFQPFQIFSKISGDIANECLSAVSATPAKKEKNFEIFFFIFC